MATASLRRLVRNLRQSAEVTRLDVPSDEELLERLLAGDTATFEVLVWRHGPLVLSACRKVLRDDMDVEDVFQATFLTLLRSARSIRTPGAVGGWLCGVAHRLAVQCLDASVRRRGHERQAARLETVRSGTDLSWREACAALHEELDRLPEMYRLPLVLCYLQGVSRDEAARQLGWSLQSLKGRLERGREKLRQRLVRRGITLSAGLLAVLGDSAVASSVPPRLVQATLQAAAGRVPARVAALVHGVTPAMKKGPTKLLLALLFVALAVTAGASLTSEQRPAASSKPKPMSEPHVARTAEVRDAVAGRVLGSDGKPIKDANVGLWPATGKEPLARTMTDAEGRFRLSVAKGIAQDGTIVATAPDRRPDWAAVPTAGGAKDLTLRLAEDDLPIEGRILSLEGKGLANVPVQVVWVSKNPDGDLTAWIEGVKKGWWFQYKRVPPEALGLPASLTTDREGRFRLTGVGRERLVYLKVRGKDNEHARFRVMTRRGLTPTQGGHHGVYPATFDHLVGPGRTASGTVRDKKTGKPLAGITVLDEMEHSSAVTDQEGRYVLHGLPRRSPYRLYAAGDTRRPYFDAARNVEAGPGGEPDRVDFELERGLVMTGRLTEKETGRPLRGRVYYAPLPGNPNYDEYERILLGRFGLKVSDWENVQPDGTFAILGVPGPAVLVPCVSEDSSFPLIDVRKELGKRGKRRWPSGPCHAVIDINADEKDAKSRTFDIALVAGRRLAGSVVGPDGKPLTGVEVAGLYPDYTPTEKLGPAGFSLKGLQAGCKRVLIFLDLERKLGKLQEVSGEEKGPLAVRLGPLGTCTGRLVDADGKPLAEHKVAVFLDLSGKDYENLPTELVPFGRTLGLGPGAWHGFTARRVVTDGEGRFRIDGLLPGVPYFVVASLDKIGPGQPVSHRKDRVTVEAGKAQDLGDLAPRREPE
ncbi:MAG: sigma-70 family RNA polymerase sigma factor [Planctomycetes bacterium]|nr:sigma-70 family RNA polymerase sigma factor [Planctomycetota bacterium]